MNLLLDTNVVIDCQAHADYVITRDKKGFTRSAVPTLTPQEWLALQAERGITCTPAAIAL